MDTGLVAVPASGTVTCAVLLSRGQTAGSADVCLRTRGTDRAVHLGWSTRGRWSGAGAIDASAARRSLIGDGQHPGGVGRRR